MSRRHNELRSRRSINYPGNKITKGPGDRMSTKVQGLNLVVVLNKAQETEILILLMVVNEIVIFL